MSILAAQGNGGMQAFSGTISSSKWGNGSFATTASRSGDVKTVDGTRTYASGRTASDSVTITRNADGSMTRDATVTRANGKIVQRDLTYSASQGGTRTVSGTITQGNGTVDQVSGTSTHTQGDSDIALLLTNPSGLTATHNEMVTTSGNTTSSTSSGTGFDGKTLSGETTRTRMTG
ncbi:MAG TPA: hypothetical protein VMB71_02975 [Acetobacteraceae bacterium]|nr:hypothetical protein [Acetobacteraceae bacterium]